MGPSEAGKALASFPEHTPILIAHPIIGKFFRGQDLLVKDQNAYTDGSSPQQESVKYCKGKAREHVWKSLGERYLGI